MNLSIRRTELRPLSHEDLVNALATCERSLDRAVADANHGADAIARLTAERDELRAQLETECDNGAAVIDRLTAERAALAAALRDIVTYVSAGDDVPLAAMLDDARAALARVQS